MKNIDKCKVFHCVVVHKYTYQSANGYLCDDLFYGFNFSLHVVNYD